MVSWDTWRVSSCGYLRLSHPATWEGDHWSRSFSATSRARTRFCASLQRFGRLARCHAAASASLARYARQPALRPISRLTVLGARPSARAIVRIDRPAITPPEISSRSDSFSANTERRRGEGHIPPFLARMPKIDEWLRSNSPAIACSDSPCRQRSHIRALSVSVYWILVRYFICNVLPSTMRV